MPLPWTDFLATWRKFTGLYPLESPLGIGTANPGPASFTNLTTTGARIKHVRIVTANYTQDATSPDEVIVGNHATTAFTITLLTPSSAPGRFLTIKNKGAANVTVSGTMFAAGSIASAILTTGQSVDLVSDSAVWNVV